MIITMIGFAFMFKIWKHQLKYFTQIQNACSKQEKRQKKLS